MDWVLTNAQYELLLCDAPVIIYDRDEDTPKEHSKKEMDDLVARWNEKKKKEKNFQKQNILKLNNIVYKEMVLYRIISLFYI